jgi:shikimate dehydrogenase
MKIALLGRDISNSMSPELHKLLAPMLADSQVAGLHYELVDCKESCDVAAWIKHAFSNRFSGANVTMPYKDLAFELAQSSLGAATEIQSANTLAFFADNVTSVSTDGAGFRNALKRELPTFNLGGYHLIAVGAGGAAKAVLHSMLSDSMPLSLTIANRSADTANQLVQSLSTAQNGPSARVIPFESLRTIRASLDAPVVVLQATPVGKQGTPGNLLDGFGWRDRDIAIDLVYDPKQTAFLSEAAEAAAKTISGLGMLIEQAALSQKYWRSGTLSDDSPISESEYHTIKSKLTHLLN